GGLHLVAILRDGVAGARVELHDAVAHAVAATFVQHRALEYGIGESAVRADRQALEAAVGALASGVAGVAGEVRDVRHNGGIPRYEVRWRREGPNQCAVTVELVEGRAVLVRDQEVARLGVDDETFGIERVAQHARRIWRDAVQRRARG